MVCKNLGAFKWLLEMRKAFQKSLLADFSHHLGQSEDPFLKRLGTILTGLEGYSSGTEQSPVGSLSPGTPQDSDFDILYARLNREESASNIPHGRTRHVSSGPLFHE